jgi:predicted ATPase/class 3 adenylate cyclase
MTSNGGTAYTPEVAGSSPVAPVLQTALQLGDHDAVSRELPSGTVTFLFTDVEGSTRLLHELGADAYSQALSEHRRLLRGVFAAHGGVEVDTQGDAFFVAFASAPDAVAAARAAQEALAPGPIGVRIGLHTGTPKLAEEGYVGVDVHLGARIAAAGHGGQVLLSTATRELIDGGVSDLGEHRLKDFAEAVWLFQLGSKRFPPLKTISNTNLPRPASSFVGRERELADVVSLVSGGARLVTLAGPGGSGKTRLAIEVAGALVPEFKNGVFWVALAALRDPALVTDSLAQTLGAKNGLAEHIGEREVLLLIDNFEQVVEAAPELAALLESCSNLSLLVTSRELLRVRGEAEYHVPPLADPEAVELFSTRSGLPADAAVADLCRRLDNLPLAVELAAARARVLSPAQIGDRLAQRLDMFKGGRDLEARQQTLRAAIAWSYDMLAPEEQQLFARLSVFFGGCTLQAVEQVCGADLDTLQSLVDKSVLRRTGERFWMLETIREFAAERLEANGEAGKLRRRHARWALGFTTAASKELHGPEQLRWLERVDEEHGNLRVALAWGLGDRDGQLGGSIAASLFWFWQHRSYLGEGDRWLAEALARATVWPTELRAKLLQGHGQLTYYRGARVGPDIPVAAAEAASAAARLLEASVGLWREMGAAGPLAESLAYLAIAAGDGGDPHRSRAAGEEGVRVARRAGDDWTLGLALWALGTTMVLGTSGPTDLVGAEPVLEESVDRLRPIGDRWALAAPLFYLGAIARGRGDTARAFQLVDEATELIRAIGDKYRLTIAVRYLAELAKARGDDQTAKRLVREAEILDGELGQLREPEPTTA